MSRLLGRVIRFGLLPAVRVGEQVRESTQRLRALRAGHQARIEELRVRMREGGCGETDASRRFDALYKANDWDEPRLALQLLAVRRTKRAAMIGALVGVMAALALVVTAPLVMLIVVVPASAGLTALGMAMTLKYGLFQAQLERRALISMREYLCRPDLFAHLFGRGGRP